MLVLLGFADVTLTFYQIFNLKKLNRYDKFLELNPIGRALIGNASPLNFVVCGLWSMAMLTIVEFFCLLFSLWVVYLCTALMLAVVIFYHMTNLRSINMMEVRL